MNNFYTAVYFLHALEFADTSDIAFNTFDMNDDNENESSNYRHSQNEIWDYRHEEGEIVFFKRVARY